MGGGGGGGGGEEGRGGTCLLCLCQFRKDNMRGGKNKMVPRCVLSGLEVAEMPQELAKLVGSLSSAKVLISNGH